MPEDTETGPRSADPLLLHAQDAPEIDDTASSSLSAEEKKTLERRLYISHSLSTWNSRLFEFGAVLFLAQLFPSTLLPMSVYAFVRSLFAMAFAHPVGAWIDTANRLKVVRYSIIGQRLPVAASCAILWLMDRGLERMSQGHVIGLLSALYFLAGVEKVSAMVNTIAIERDWVVAISEGDDAWRRALNARMRRIDLICKLLGPLSISIIAGVSNKTAIAVTFGVNLASVVSEYACIAKVYNAVAALRRTDYQTNEAAEPQPVASRLRAFALAVVPVSSFADYFSHRAFLPSFALSLLYLTVLSFSGQFITFLMSVGYNPIHVGVARTGSTIVELSATWAAPRLMLYMGPIRGGIWSLSWQMICLTLGLGLFLRDGLGTDANHTMTSVAGLIVCIALSRLGLWGYDLCAQTIVQEEVQHGGRGAFSSVEASFQNLFELLSFATTIAFSRPEQFHWPLIISISAVYTAGGLYAFFVRHRRGHLFHPPACLKAEFEN